MVKKEKRPLYSVYWFREDIWQSAKENPMVNFEKEKSVYKICECDQGHVRWSNHVCENS